MIAVVIILAVVAALVIGFVSLAKRDTVNATGRLSRETRSRDKASETPVELEAESSSSGREVEKTAVLARIESGRGVAETGTAAPVVWVPPDPDTVGATRRQFLNRSVIGFFGLNIGVFGGAILAFLWPSRISGFGSQVNLGDLVELKTTIRDNDNFFYFATGRLWVTEYPVTAIENARETYTSADLVGMENGVVALFQKCPHLGCRVPECGTSQFFECPCHGSRYNRVGEKRGGPAPRGMDRFAVSLNGANELIVDTGAIIQGPPIGVNTTGQEPEGPSCLGAGTHG